MQKKNLCFVVIAFLFWGCTKINNVTNNLPNTHRPAFTIRGLTDLTISAKAKKIFHGFSVAFEDSVEELVTLKFSEPPPGITMSAYWYNSGYPSFATGIYFYDTEKLVPAVPGVYDMVLTATGSVTGARQYPFKVNVVRDPECVSSYLGGYPLSQIVNATTYYHDSIYADPVYPNKIWFLNLANSGRVVAGIYDCTANSITIPQQVIEGDSISGYGGTNGTPAPFKIELFVKVNNRNVNLRM